MNRESNTMFYQMAKRRQHKEYAQPNLMYVALKQAE